MQLVLNPVKNIQLSTIELPAGLLIIHQISEYLFIKKRTALATLSNKKVAFKQFANLLETGRIYGYCALKTRIENTLTKR
jgi:hypothetical protein